MKFEKALQAQAAAHPSMQAQDAVKLCYQAAFGPEHLLRGADRERVHTIFNEEFLSTPAADGVLCEPISPAYCRVNLSVWKNLGLPSEWLYRMFFFTAAEERGDQTNHYHNALKTTVSLAKAGRLPFPAEELQNYLSTYKGGPVHHTHAYRLAEQPSYRIISSRYRFLIPVLKLLARLPQQASAAVIAIDGRAASGKTTLASRLANVTGAPVIHMDDFFLPPELRTSERLAEPGGNIHYERFLMQVLPHLRGSASFSYPRFDCETMDYGAAREIERNRLRIVEGAYSCHPTFGTYMDLRIFCDISRTEQLNRIRKRNGPEKLKTFTDRWIPMEEQYLETFHIQDKAQVLYEEGGRHLPDFC